MPLNSVIFDMDGLLIDSEPYWQEAGMETMQQFDITLTLEQYHFTTGLRTKEWIDHWFTQFGISKTYAVGAENAIVAKAIEKIHAKAEPMPGIDHIFSFFRQRRFRIGLATSSPLELVDTVVNKLRIGALVQAISSAGSLSFSKPHPQVYLNCAEQLGVNPVECLCFEDSFNGLISAKAARMKCVIIPTKDQVQLAKWGAADLKLGSLLEFGETQFDALK
ncbi:MAG: hexitol phosphatase HxpB [Bacteroidota bacterium]|nr:hexitol phosphatase HxpB [Bacteroidota bacterium]MDP4218653.1 hexitol phosphatase HxpB [Bacteroidota bacterium]MDP4247325.1 hexitol phosphatase HxpB [Bacteroidota bacterium]MDP4256137.1 hexitol phosphatase HxpB [Bacteroidota bacterium]MDP4258139.1 hexitol phosphatase HxpB [Bacteroidota bacterium]